MKKAILSLSLAIFMWGCQNDFRAAQLSQTVADDLICENFESKMFETLHFALDEEQELPKTTTLIKHLKSDFRKLEVYRKKPELVKSIIAKFEHFYNDLSQNFPKKLKATDVQSLKQALSQIETRDTLSKTKKEVQSKYQNQLSELKKLAVQLKQTCEDQGPSVPIGSGRLFQELKSKYPIEVSGGLKTIATAYQNCEALKREALASSQQSLEGVSIIGRHSSGAGNKRIVSNLRSVQKTHPYLSEKSPESSCFSTFESPLIYDFGGKPAFTSSNESKLNFFKNGGTGTQALGTDCSGFIFTSLVTAGLKLHPDRTPKARDVDSYNANRFKDPINGGTSCLAKIKVAQGESLQAGDIVASSGHIFMVSQIGSDPFGLNGIKSASECKTKITYKNFDFEVIQSSPTNGAIGINRMKANYYLGKSSSMRQGLEAYAQSICKARFSPISEPNLSKVSIVRHKKTPECISSHSIALTGESCVASCSL